MYECSLCNYKTDDSGNYSNHKKTKKHLSKISLSKFNKDKEIEELKQKLKDKESEMQKMIIQKENEKLEAINKIYQEQSKIINNTQNNTINIGTLNYIIEKFPDAPPLERLTNFIINGIDTNDASQHDKFIKDIIYYHKNKILHTFLGDHIIKLYKKTDLTEQSFHTTDTSRLNYAVRIVDNVDFYDSEDENTNLLIMDINDDKNSDSGSDEEKELKKLEQKYLNKLKKIKKQKEQLKMMQENKKLWITDKNGYKICKLLIEPTINHMLDILKNKLKQKQITKKKTNINNINDELDYYKNVNEIIVSIDTKKLKNDINKYIAPVFNLAKK
jgi:hypothetical protein